MTSLDAQSANASTCFGRGVMGDNGTCECSKAYAEDSACEFSRTAFAFQGNVVLAIVVTLPLILVHLRNTIFMTRAFLREKRSRRSSPMSRRIVYALAVMHGVLRVFQHLVQTGDYVQIIPLAQGSVWDWAASTSTIVKVTSLQLCLCVQTFAVQTQLQILKVIWNPWRTHRSPLASTIIISGAYSLLAISFALLGTLAPGVARYTQLALLSVSFAQIAYLTVLIGVMGRGLEATLDKVGSCGMTVAARDETGATVQEPLVSQSMRRSMVSYRKGVIPIGICSVITILIDVAIPDQGSLGLVQADYVLAVWIPSFLEASVDFLVSMTIPQRSLGNGASSKVYASSRAVASSILSSSPSHS
jgi:hypothetical protein